MILIWEDALMTIIFGLLLSLAALPAQSNLKTVEVDSVQRQAIVYPNSRNAQQSGAPVVFVFHGHGGTAQNAARRFQLHSLWPEAVVVYMQGLPGVQGITDPEGERTGWQKSPGALADRDVKFFDTTLAQIQKQYRTDPRRVYLLGHSNGSRFVNVLWNMRGDKIAALCSSGGQGGRLLEGARPLSVFMIAGEKDPLVPYKSQMLSIEYARKLLKTDSSKAKVEGYARTEPGINGIEWVGYLHPGGHEFPLDAIPMIVKFFQRHSR